MEPISDQQQQRPVSVIPMKRSLSTENDANVDQSPGPGAHHATPVHNMGTPEPPVSSSGKHVKTKQPKERVSHREGGREKKESWKKKEAQGTPAGTPAVSNIKTSHTPDPTVATEGPPGLQRFPLPPTKDADYLPAKPPILVPITYMKDTEIQYCETTDHPGNRKGFRYIPCKATHNLPHLKFHCTEVAPYASRIAFEDKSVHIHVDPTGTIATTEKGYRLARANVGVREGDWYYECKIISGISGAGGVGGVNGEDGHVRLGWARREASLEAPIGFDAYGYCLRDVEGQTVHMSRPKDFMKENFVTGDVLGLHISLPSLATQRAMLTSALPSYLSGYPPDVIRDRVPIKYKAQLYFEQFEYMPIKEMEDLMNPAPNANPTMATNQTSGKSAKACFKTLPGSSIRVYKNGVFQGIAFEDLFAFLPPASQPITTSGGRIVDDGFCGYYPALSVYRGGSAKFNFGPYWEYPPEDLNFSTSSTPSQISSNAATVRPMCERYNEQIAEDVTYDLIDEVDTWMFENTNASNDRHIDSVVSSINGSKAESQSRTGLASGHSISTEIKEITIDEE